MDAAPRIVFLISDTGELPAWELGMIDRLLEKGLVIDISFACIPAKKKQPSSLLYRLFTKLENSWFRSLPDSYKKIPVKEKYPQASFFPLTDEQSLEADVAWLSCLADENYSPRNIPRLGIWSLQLGSGQYKNAIPAAFWEVMNNEAVIGSSLVVQLPGKNNPLTVYEGSTTTVPYSVKNTINVIAWKAASFMSYRLQELMELGCEAFHKKYEAVQKNEEELAISPYKIPGNFNMLSLFTRNLYKYVGYKFAKKKNERFTLLYSREQFAGGQLNLNAFKPIPLPEGVFYADPFIITKDGTHYIFFEEYIYTAGKAHISVLTIDQNGKSSTPVTVLDKPYHLSYPFVFEWQGDYYMIPETAANKTVELYKATQFPYQWEWKMNLVENIALLDVTLHFENDTWWLFANAGDIPFASTNDQLLLYYSNELFSNSWSAHPQNPVATHIANCRPAGKIFRQNNQLFRPAQNNASRQYGYGISINKITTLTETNYSEEQVATITPGKDNQLTAVHTFNFSDGIILIDGIIK